MAAADAVLERCSALSAGRGSALEYTPACEPTCDHESCVRAVPWLAHRAYPVLAHQVSAAAARWRQSAQPLVHIHPRGPWAVHRKHMQVNAVIGVADGNVGQRRLRQGLHAEHRGAPRHLPEWQQRVLVACASTLAPLSFPQACGLGCVSVEGWPSSFSATRFTCKSLASAYSACRATRTLSCGGSRLLV